MNPRTETQLVLNIYRSFYWCLCKIRSFPISSKTNDHFQKALICLHLLIELSIQLKLVLIELGSTKASCPFFFSHVPLGRFSITSCPSDRMSDRNRWENHFNVDFLLIFSGMWKDVNLFIFLLLPLFSCLWLLFPSFLLWWHKRGHLLYEGDTQTRTWLNPTLPCFIQN